MQHSTSCSFQCFMVIGQLLNYRFINKSNAKLLRLGQSIQPFSFALYFLIYNSFLVYITLPTNGSNFVKNQIIVHGVKIEDAVYFAFERVNNDKRKKNVKHKERNCK